MRYWGGGHIRRWTEDQCEKQVRYWYDGAAKARLTPFELLLFERGRDVEQAYLDIAAKNARSYLDIHDLPRREQVDATIKAMSEGIDAIAHPLFSLRHADGIGSLGIQLSGEADLIRRVGDGRLPNGLFDYEVAEIKSSYSVHPYHLTQLAHYSKLLGEVLGHDVKRGVVVILGRGADYEFEEVQVDLQQPMAEIERFLQDDLPRIVTDPDPDYHLLSKCGTCPYRQQCEVEAVEASHLSLLPGLRKRHRADLLDAGVETWPELAVPRQQFAKIEQRWQGTSWILERVRTQAMSLAYETSLDRGSLLEPLRLLLPDRGERAAVDEANKSGHAVVFLDLEADPLRGNVYLYGYQIEVSPRGLLGDARRTLEAPVQKMSVEASEADLFEEFLDAIDARRHEHGRLIVLHYGYYETSQLTALARKYNHIKDVGERVARLCSECLNLHATLVATRALPVRSYSLKEVAPCLARLTQGRHGHKWGGPTDRSSLFRFLCDAGMGFTDAKRNVEIVQRAADDWDLSLAEILKPSAGSSVLWHREDVSNSAPVWGTLIRAYNHDDLLAARAVAGWLLDELHLELKEENAHQPTIGAMR